MEGGMPDRKRWIGRSTALVAVLLAAACGGSASDPTGGDFEQLPADQIMIGVEFTATSAGVRSAKMLSDTAYMFEDSTVMHLRSVDLEVFDETGRRTAHVTSDRGIFDQVTQKMIAIGNVVLTVVRDGQKIETEELHYDPETRRVWSDVATRRTEADGTVTTVESFTADDQFTNLQTRGARGGRPRTNISF